MIFQLGIKTYEISSDDPDVELGVDFEPALTFTLRSKPRSEWYDHIGQINADEVDVELCANIIAGMCLKVSNDDNELQIAGIDDAMSIHGQLKAIDPVMADEMFFKLSYRLAGRLMAIKQDELEALKKTSDQSNGTGKKKRQAKQS